MPKKMIKKSAYLSVFILFLSFVVSCEKDFTDIGTSVINNTKFEIKDTIFEIEVSEKSISSVRGDGLNGIGALGQYLLGVYNNYNNTSKNYKTLEASIVTQIALPTDLKLVDDTYGADTIVVSKIDTAFIKLPYQVTAVSDETNKYTLDSIIGDKSKSFSVKVYRILTYLNRLNPNDPTKPNEFLTDFSYQKENTTLNESTGYSFKPNENDTVFYIKRRLNSGVQFTTDTLKMTNSAPFARIPLNSQKIEDLFLKKYNSTEFQTQDNFNDYFRGILVEASGTEGSVIGFNLLNASLRPSIEIYYTNTVIETKGGLQKVIDTIKKNNTFSFGGVSNSLYKMTPNNTLANSISIQGTAGSIAEVKIFGDDNDNNQVADALEEIRSKNWLINGASLSFYVDQSVVKSDTISSPYRLFLYKNGENNGNEIPSQISDMITDGPAVFGGVRELKDSKPYRYTFNITDYVSKLANGKTDYLPKLGLKVFNYNTDIPSSVTDTIIDNFSWNPKAVTILDHSNSHGDKRAILKVSYTIKK